jgi:hypothetical protein
MSGEALAYAVLPSPPIARQIAGSGSRSMDSRLEWIVRKGALALLLFLALTGGAEWLRYVIAAFVWWTLAANVWTPLPGSRSRATTIDVPIRAAMAFDLAFLAALFVAHWYWTAFAYAISCACAALVQARASPRS